VKRRIRVLQVIQNLNYGGMERLLADLACRVDPARFELHVLVLSYLGRFSAGLEQYAKLHVADPLPRWSMLWPGPLIRQIQRIAPDVVHTHSGVWYKVSLAARLAGVPRLIHTDHGRPNPDPWRTRMLDRLAAQRTDVIVPVSEPLRRYLKARVVPDPSRLRVIRNGVDTDTFRPKGDDGRVRRELSIPAEAFMLGSVGRLESIKGYDVMVSALQRLRAAWRVGPAPVLVIGGEGSERPRLKGMIETARLQAHVRLLGWREDVPDLHAAFGLFTMSSRSEGTSVSLLEAMSAGLCPVVTDVGGNADVLGQELRHRLVPPDDPKALATAWLDALRDSRQRRRDGDAARRRVEARFGVDAMVRAYERLYVGSERREKKAICS
jgi:glycosyltransferase involved in cell wall biosynthesis